MILTPVLHDFKRGMLRLSTLIILALFIAGGLGLTYLLRYQFLTTATPLNRVQIVSIDPSEEKLYLEMYVFDEQLNKVKGDLRFTITCNGKTVVEMMKSIDGYIKIVDRIPRDTSITSSRCSALTQLTAPMGYLYSYTVLYNLSVNSKTILYSIEGASTISLINRSTNSLAGLATLKIFRRDAELIVIGGIYTPANPYAEFDIYVKNISATSLQTLAGRSSGSTSLGVGSLPQYVSISAKDLEKLGFIRIGRVKQGIFNSTSEPNIYMNTSYLQVVIVSSTQDIDIYSNPIVISVSKVLKEVDVRMARILNTMISLIGTFTTFFPIVGLYLAYIYIAKPRSQGALEFLLARPVTRFEIYMSRALAGMITLVVASTLFFISTTISTNVMLQVSLDINSLAVLFLGLTISLLAFYSLCYFLSTVISGGKYLALSITIYLIFTFIWQIVIAIISITTLRLQQVEPVKIVEEMARNQYRSYYFNPIQLSNFYQFYTQKKYVDVLPSLQVSTVKAVEDIVNPYLVALASILWIATPLVLGWIVFRKANLSR